MVEETPAVVQKYYQICKCGHTRFSHKLFADGCDGRVGNDCTCTKFEKTEEKPKVKRTSKKKRIKK